MMKKNGIHTVYFGKNISLDELEYYCQHKQVTHLYFHLITNLARCDPDEYITKLLKLFPDKQIIVSGSRAQAISGSFRNVKVLKSIEEMLSFAKEK